MQYVTAEEGSAIKPPRRQSLPSRQEAQPDSSSEEEAEEAANGKANGQGGESSSEDEGEGQEEDVIALPSEKPSRSALINRRLLEGMNNRKPQKTTQGDKDKPARHMGLDTGLPTPSYIKYDSLGGKVMRASVGGGKEHPKHTLKDAMLANGPSEAVQKKLAVQRVGIARQHLSRVCPCQCLDSVCCGCVCSVGCV